MLRRPAINLSLALTLALSAAGCGGLPTNGPRASELVDQARSPEARRMGIVLVDMTPAVATLLQKRRGASLVESFGEGTPAVPLIGVGDTVSVTIWEAGAGALFSTPSVPGQPMAPTRGAVLPNMVVQPDGMITVPYAGRVPVAGLDPAGVERILLQRLTGKALDPQAVVTVVTSVANSVTVGGGASGGARVPLSVKGDRVLDAIATAGGIRVSMDDAVINLTRGNRTVAIPYAVILGDARENIYLRPGDILTVVARPASFLAFGAVQRNGQINFDSDAISLSEAIAKSAGLSDSRADPEGVFLFRYENSDLVRNIAPMRLAPGANGMVPVIYRVNLRNPAHLFLARQVAMQDKDMLYVATAPLNDLQKFFGVIGAVVAPAGNAVGVGASVITLSQ